MSRQVRRVPVGWKHPTEPNPHWVFQEDSRRRCGLPSSRLHLPQERYIPLYPEPVSLAQVEWDHENAEWDAGTHSHLEFELRYCSSEGYLNRDGTRDEPRPYRVYDEDGETVIREFHPSTTAQIVEVYPYEDYAGQRPTAETNMPDFDVPADHLGWCLYETVSEGTPVTPVFATAEELIDHLATVGEDYDQKPWRRSAAERVVTNGGSFASLVVFNGGTNGAEVYQGAKDADKIADRFARTER